MRSFLSFVFLLVLFCAQAQKKPLDHTVYDGWQSIGERHISADGKWVAYTVSLQEGDGVLYVHDAATGAVTNVIPRGYGAVISNDAKFLICRIKPLFSDTRAARIKKKKPEEMPKDSLAVLALGSDALFKVARVASYKMPKEGAVWLAYQKEKMIEKSVAAGATQKTVDSLQRKVDSLLQLVTTLKNVKAGNADEDADEPADGGTAANEGSDLVLRQLWTGRETVYKNVGEFIFDKSGTRLLLQALRNAKDSSTKNAVVLVNLANGKRDTILKGGNSMRNLALSDDGAAAAFVAERDSSAKALQKFYALYLYQTGNDTAQKIVAKESAAMPQQWTVSEWAPLTFSKSGNRLFFGTAPVRAPKDTTLVEADLVKLDIWNYKDDYLQSQQLFTLQADLKRSYAAVYDIPAKKMVQLGSKTFPAIVQMAEGDSRYFIAATDTGRRVQAQWTGRTAKDIYAAEVATGKTVLVKKDLNGTVYPSAAGKYILWYDAAAKHYYSWDGGTIRKISGGVPAPLYNEEHDAPSEPAPYGVMGWHNQDSFVYVYDKYDVWKLDPTAKAAPRLMFGDAATRKAGITYRYVRLDSTERFITSKQKLLFRTFNHQTKTYNLQLASCTDEASDNKTLSPVVSEKVNYNNVSKARDANIFIYTKERFDLPPDLYVNSSLLNAQHQNNDGRSLEHKLSHINPQQAQYNWGTATLVKWKTFTGKTSEGILYKPEDFDTTKKYPMVVYFYEKMSETLHNYLPPSPTPSRLNIPFYTSRGYLVFVPDISYTKGQPAKDAYNYIVSGVQTLKKNKWVDAANIGLQGQSWGGYQVVALLVQTPMFKAAWAGAPVANMTSAYGGIRWESGANRQFQYEKQQSRIGASLWERPDLYIQNSPLFSLPKVKTPLVIMANDADGAVPWYQGIELFTAMRRLNKPVWMLNYNGEAHNLVERKNRKDIQIRQQQFFDWLLKGAQPPRWITEGVPATEKGRDWGL